MSVRHGDYGQPVNTHCPITKGVANTEPSTSHGVSEYVTVGRAAFAGAGAGLYSSGTDVVQNVPVTPAPDVAG